VKIQENMGHSSKFERSTRLCGGQEHDDDEGIDNVMRVIDQWWVRVNLHHRFLKNPL
jgi:hypothetical protein